MTNQVPYTITVKSADYLVKIAEIVTRLEYSTDFKQDIRLHRENRLQTIHSSLAIEGNSLSFGEVTAIIDGKRVLGMQSEILEVENAYKAYDRLMDYDPYSIKDFLQAHSLMTDGLISEFGKFRSGDVGVFAGDVTVHIGARPQFVPSLVHELFAWAKESDLHPVLKSAIMHYEIEIIHPFSDGNGRMGRLWQTLILAKWNSIFEWVPMESVIYEKRPEYYEAISTAKRANDSSSFIEFTLSAVLDSLSGQLEKLQNQEKMLSDDLSDTQKKVLKSLAEKALSRKDIFEAIGISGDSRSFTRHISPLISDGLIEMTLPDKPTSRLQKYRLTDKGKVRVG